MKNSIRIKANASVANVSCGFDCLGYAISSPGDIVTIQILHCPLEFYFRISLPKYRIVPKLENVRHYESYYPKSNEQPQMCFLQPEKAHHHYPAFWQEFQHSYQTKHDSCGDLTVQACSATSCAALDHCWFFQWVY